ncbi:DUF3368 domain-containing protein [Candidatus Magnetomoraceae bacterium gMMP-15]
MKVVSNTTPLIGLASIKRFNLLQHIFGEIYIAEAVCEEATFSKSNKAIGKYEILSSKWIHTLKVRNRKMVEKLLNELDLGEAESIVLALEIDADWVLMDERKGRQKLLEMGLNKIGTVGILLKAKNMGLLPFVRPELEKLCRKGFRLSQAVIDRVLKHAGEFNPTD